MPYLVLSNAKDFLNFAKIVFGAKEHAMHLNDDGSIMHGEIKIGDSVIMFGNSGDQWSAQNAGLYVYVEDADQTYHKALENGATSVMEMSDKDYGRTGGIKDVSGNVWWLTTAPKD